MTKKKSMPPELLAHFKKKQEGTEKEPEAGESSKKEGDKERRKEAVKKARIRMEEKSRRGRDDQKEEVGKGRSQASRASQPS